MKQPVIDATFGHVPPPAPKQSLPRFVQIEPVGQCNLKCRMCAVKFRKDRPRQGGPSFMDFEVFTRVIDEVLPEAGELHLQGLGEPLLHPRFFDMVRYAAERGLRVTTHTNLTLLSDQRARECVECGLAEVQVSLDGASAHTYERIRMGARFDEVVGNIRRLARMREQSGADLPRLSLVAAAMRQNLDELPALVRLAGEWGTESLFVHHLCAECGEEGLPPYYRPLREFVQGETLLGETPQRVSRAFAEAREAAAQAGIELRLPRVHPRARVADDEHHSPCDWPWTGVYVSYQGYLMPCSMIGSPDRLALGCLQDEGVRSIWAGDAFGDFRSRLQSDDLPDVCRGCPLRLGAY